MRKSLILLIVVLFFFFKSDVSLKRNVEVRSNFYLVGETPPLSITSDDYSLDDSYVKFVRPKTIKDDFISKFKVSNAVLNLECNNGTNYVGSACKLQVRDLSMKNTPYSVVVVGDVNGDGNNTITDIVKVATYSKNQSGLTNESYVLAADLDNDKKVSDKDMNSLAYYTVGSIEIPVSNDPSVSASIELLTKTLILSKGSSGKIETKVNQSGVSIIEWSSSDKSVVDVDSTGTVVGIGAGKATITAKASNGESASVQASVVVVVPATGVSFNNVPSQMEVGSSHQISATVSPGDATNKSLTWVSDKPNIATVDNTGKVTAKAGGTATITATTATGKSTKTTITVVVSATKVELNKTTLNLVKGTSETLTATVTPTNVTNKGVTWSSNNTAVATVDANGKVTAVGNGLALITVTSADGKQKATCNVTVENLSLTLSATSATVIDGRTKTLKATLSSSAVDQSITWTSSDTSVASVDNGKVTAKKSGTATITATSNFDSSVKTTCDITVRAAKYLFVGNSKTYKPGGQSEDNGIPKRFQAIASNRGYEIEYTLAVDGGEMLLDLYDMKYSKITSKKFDYVILQEKTAVYSAENISDYYNGVLKIIEKVREKNSSIKPYIRKLWVSTDSTTTEINRAYSNTSTIISRLKSEKGYDIGVINDGQPFYDVLNNYKSINIASDDVHQTNEGAYLSALCIYSTIYGKDPTKVTYNSSIDSDVAGTLKTVASKWCYNSVSTQ